MNHRVRVLEPDHVQEAERKRREAVKQFHENLSGLVQEFGPVLQQLSQAINTEPKLREQIMTIINSGHPVTVKEIINMMTVDGINSLTLSDDQLERLSMYGINLQVSKGNENMVDMPRELLGSCSVEQLRAENMVDMARELLGSCSVEQLRAFDVSKGNENMVDKARELLGSCSVEQLRAFDGMAMLPVDPAEIRRLVQSQQTGYELKVKPKPGSTIEKAPGSFELDVKDKRISHEIYWNFTGVIQKTHEPFAWMIDPKRCTLSCFECQGKGIVQEKGKSSKCDKCDGTGISLPSDTRVEFYNEEDDAHMILEAVGGGEDVKWFTKLFPN